MNKAIVINTSGMSVAGTIALAALESLDMEDVVTVSSEDDLSVFKSSELVMLYNNHAEKPVKKFRDLGTARKRVMTLLTDSGLEFSDLTPAEKEFHATMASHQSEQEAMGSDDATDAKDEVEASSETDDKEEQSSPSASTPSSTVTDQASALGLKPEELDEIYNEYIGKEHTTGRGQTWIATVQNVRPGNKMVKLINHLAQGGKYTPEDLSKSSGFSVSSIPARISNLRSNTHPFRLNVAKDKMSGTFQWIGSDDKPITPESNDHKVALAKVSIGYMKK